MTQHRKWHPDCPFVLGQSVGNIPLGEKTGPENISKKKDQAEEDCQTAELNEATASAEETQSDHRSVR